ncbi:fungal-specific transcription factor domain-containing protein [Xylogone sp. PMI_703]|nr:fungal-specific transcription factor domain-containing protein [Xylogone sp. PMI_703]
MAELDDIMQSSGKDAPQTRSGVRSGRGRSMVNKAISKRYRCAICTRSFDRKDTLNRHMQIHDENRPPPAPRKRSCEGCCKSKVKCSGDFPSCIACLKRSARCVYINTRRKSTQSQSEALASASDSMSPFDTVSQNNLDTNVACESISGNGMLSPQSSLEISGPESDNTMLYSSMDLTSQQASMTDQDGFFTTGFGFETFGYSDLSDCMQNSSLDWMFRSALDNNFGLQFPHMPDNNLIHIESVDELQENLQIQTTRNNTNDQNTVQQDSHKVMDALDFRPKNRCDPDDPWPMEWYAASIHNSELPMLGHDGDSPFNGASYFGMDPITPITRGKMIDSIRLALERSWPDINLTNFPSEEKLDHCVDLYFAHFHRTFPIIHQPTFDPAKDPVVITLAVACIGACYTEFDGARSFANALSELNRRLLLFMSEQDRRFVRTEFYIAAQLLQGTHGYCCGNKRLFELSDAFRSSVVSNARCMGLFEDRPPTVPVDDSPTAKWHAWIVDERIRRLAWAVYEYDSQVSYLHNTRPCLSVSEMRLALPSPLAMWEAESAHVWMSLHPWTESVPQNLPFRPTIHGLFERSEMGIGKVTDDQHQLIVVITLTRMLWSVKEFEASPINDLVRQTHFLKDSKRHIQEVLDRFLIMQVPTTKTALSNFVRKIQMIHMSHLYGAGDLMDWIRPMLRGRKEAEGARRRMIAWGAEDPVRIRSITYHSAQTLAILRRFPHNEPLEAFNVFHAGVVLWCMAGLLSENRPSNISCAHQEKHRGVYRIDITTRRGETCAHSQIDEDWIVNGGPQVVSLHGVPDLCCPRGQIQVLEQTAEILERMQVWGISQSFLLVTLQMIQREEEKKE